MEIYLAYVGAGGEGGNGTVGCCGGELAYGLGTAVAGSIDAFHVGLAIFTGHDVTCGIQLDQWSKFGILRHLTDCDEESVHLQGVLLSCIFVCYFDTFQLVFTKQGCYRSIQNEFHIFFRL